MSRISNRHTMGQDWGGRRPLNPPNAPKVTGNMLFQYAKEHNIKIKRDGYWWASGMWMYCDNEKWFTAGQTNYLAMETLKRLVLKREAK